MKHNDFVLTESAAILNYIDAISNNAFISSGAKTRAQYDQLAFFVLSELEQPLWTTGRHKFAVPEEHRVEQVLETAKWEFKKALRALSKLVTFDSFMLNNRFNFEVPAEHLNYRDRMYDRKAAVDSIAKFS